MVKQLKFIALVVACSSVAYGFGFAWQDAVAPAKQVRAVSQGPAAVQSNFHDTLTPIQQALMMHVTHVGNVALVKVQDDKTRERIIIAQNYLVMAILDPTQQQANLKWIQLDAYRPGPGPWNRVRYAPTMAEAILKVTPEQRKQFAKWAAEDLERRRQASKYLEGLPREEAIQRHREEMAKKTRKQHQAEWSARLAREQAQIRSILTREQREEWDEIMALTKKEYARAIGS